MNALLESVERPQSLLARWWRLGAVLLVLLLGAVASLLYARSLPDDPSLQLTVRSSAFSSDDWRTPAVESLVRRRFGTTGPLGIGDAHAATVDVFVDVRPIGDVFEVSLHARRIPFGLERRVASVRAPSVDEALQQAMRDARPVLEHRDVPSATEVELMRFLDADDVRLVRGLQAVTDCYWNTRIVPLQQCQQLADELHARAPHWAWSALAQWVAHGANSPQSDAHLDEALDQVEQRGFGWVALQAAARRAEPNGADAFLAVPRGELPGLARLVTMPITQFVLPEALRTAETRALFDAWPYLQFGDTLLEGVTASEGEAVVEQWRRLAPESQALVEVQARRLLVAGEQHQAVRLLREAMTVFGESPALQLDLADALIATADHSGAREQLQRMNRSSDRFLRTFALARLADLDAYDGRYTAALVSLREALELGLDYGLEVEYAHIAGSAYRLAMALGDPSAMEMAGRVSIDFAQHTNGSATQALFEFELARRTTRCPPLQRWFDFSRGKQDEDSLKRTLIRRSAAIGCLPCAAATAAGVDPQSEWFTWTLVDLAHCQLSNGQYHQGLESLEVAEGVVWLRSAHDRVRTQLMRARLFEALGRRDDAIAAYTAFLRYWQHADHVVAERRIAEAALERLQSTR